MKKVTMLFCISLLHGAAAFAAEPTLVALENPRLATGIHIGDVLERKLVVEAPSPYELPKTALPLKGERINGMELVGVTLQNPQKSGDNKRYELTLKYQVFAAASKPVVMHLPEIALPLAGGDASAEIHVPTWHFWYTPLASGDIHTARSNAQPQRKPVLLDTNPQQLAVSLAVLLLGVGGLIYINADRRWLPWMGGSFAQAYRKLRRLPAAQAGAHAQALGYLHQAFNCVHGQTLFRSQLGEFLAQHPQYQPLGEEIDRFFQRSEALLFTREHADSAVLVGELQQFCRRLRNCERRVA